MNDQGGRILQRMLWASVALFIIATFLGGSLAVGVAWVFGIWLFIIVVGPILDALLPNKHQKP